MSTDTSPAPDQTLSYADVPFFRKRWMIVVLFLVFIPAMIVIVLTGPVWQNDDGRAVRWPDKQRYQAAAGGVIFMLIGLLQLATAM